MTTIKTLSEDDFQIMWGDYDVEVANVAELNVSPEICLTNAKRLKELFAELKKQRCNGFCDLEYNGDFVEFATIKKLFAPLVPKEEQK